jgi:hypothetical protein
MAIRPDAVPVGGPVTDFWQGLLLVAELATVTTLVVTVIRLRRELARRECDR